MKKFFLFLSVILISVTFLVGSTISITSPHLNDLWYKGKTYKIKWDKSGVMNNYVKIRLLNGSTKIPIIDSTENDGLFEWNIPSTLADGSYVIRVKTTDNKVYDDSDTFNIKSSLTFKVVPPGNMEVHKKPPVKDWVFKIKILSPNGGNFKEGAICKIKWEKNFIKGKKVNIYLLDYTGNNVLRTIAANLVSFSPGFGVYDWKIQKGTYKFPGKFRIKIETTDKKTSGISNVFNISLGIVKKSYRINATTSNRYKSRTQKKGAGILGGAPFISSKEDNNPGNGKLRVGFHNFFKKDTISYIYVGYIYRAHAFFDLSSLKGKGLITKAILHFRKYSDNSCGVKVYKVNKSTSNYFNVDMDLIQNPHENIAQIVRKWVAYPNSNFGLIFTGLNENFSHNNDSCVDYYDDVYLEVEILEKK